MSKEKAKLQISASALVELKATLFSKQREVRDKEKKGRRADGAALVTNTVSEKTSAIWRRPPKQKRSGRAVMRDTVSERDTYRSAEEEAELERSRKALEAKAALYDRLCGGEGVRGRGSDSEDDEDGRYMVDFTRKIAEERKTQQPPSPSSTNDRDSDVREGVAEEVGEWAEYVDSFGRTRRCPKEDLPKMEDEDQRRRERSVTPDPLSEDMAQERERRRWEREQAEELDKPLGPLHYEEMRQGEVRSHGVGYYAFSKDEEKRSEQLNLLNKLREQTVNQREKKLKLQEKRKALMAARLAKVRERKQLKQPVTQVEVEPDTTEGTVEEGKEEEEGCGLTEVKVFDPIAAMIDSELSHAREKAEKDGGDKAQTKKPYVRPWDKGKVMDPIRKRKKELEDERLPEFAPPSFYNKNTSQPKVTKVDRADTESDQKQPLAHEGGSSISDGPESEIVMVESNSGPVPPPPTLNQTVPPPTNIGPYPYPPPNMLFYNQYGPPPNHIGPQPPPPPGPIPPVYTGVQPLYYYPYFRPPPPPSGVPPPPPPPSHQQPQ